jgi:amino acid transporter
MELAKTLGLRDVVLFNVTAIVGLRWIAIAAAAGSTSITLWFAAMLLFFLPQGFAVMELTRRMPAEGGIYAWTRETFGEFHGFLAGWCYWTNNLVYFPGLLVYVAGVSVYVLGIGFRARGEDAGFVLVFSMSALVLVTLANIFGLSTGKWISNIGGLGTWLTGATLVVLAGIAAWRFGLANAMPIDGFFAGLMSYEKLSFLSSICFAFAGLELLPVLAGEVQEAERTIPRAVVIAGIAIASIYTLGTLALLVALPAAEINIISGIVQAIAALSDRLGIPWATNLLALLVTLGGIGGLMAWFTGAARIAFVAGVDRFLPAGFGKIHPRYGTPYVAVIVQAVVAMVFVLMSFVGASVEEAYLVLLDTTLLVYFIPYVYMFATQLRVRTADPEAGRVGTLIGAAGLTTTLVAMVISLLPPADVSSPWLYETKVVGGVGGFLGAGAFVYWREQRSRARSSRE